MTHSKETHFAWFLSNPELILPAASSWSRFSFSRLRRSFSSLMAFNLAFFRSNSALRSIFVLSLKSRGCNFFACFRKWKMTSLPQLQEKQQISHGWTDGMTTRKWCPKRKLDGKKSINFHKEFSYYFLRNCFEFYLLCFSTNCFDILQLFSDFISVFPGKQEVLLQTLSLPKWDLL